MKLTVVFLSLAVALAMGQNYYLQFSGSSKDVQPAFQHLNDVAPYYRLDEAHPLAEYVPVRMPSRGPYGYGHGYVGVEEPTPRIFFSNVFSALGIMAVTNYRYTTTTTFVSTSMATVNCVSLKVDDPQASKPCTGRLRRGILEEWANAEEVISPSNLESVDATAVPWLEGMGQRQVRQLELASSQDEEGVASENGGSMKYPQKRQLFRNPFVTNVITASVVTSFTATTTIITADGEFICIPPGYVECAA